MYSEAIVDIKDILTEEFSEEGFTHLAINLVNLESENLLNSTYLNEDSTVYENHVDYIKDIGKYRDTDRNTIVLSIVKLKHSPEKSRTMQRNFIAKHMKDIGADVSIVGLYSEDTDVWRISFVKLDYSIDIDGIHEKLTPAKRYSYLIEPGLNNHTAVEQLSKLYYDDSKKANVQDIENAFSVEVVTDEFFKMYKEKYLDLKELLEKDVNFISEAQRLDIEIHDFSEEFAKKLMGQISFLYFLQKKGWLGVKIVPKKISKVELREIYRRQDEETRNIINKVYKPKNEFMVLSSRALKELSNEDAEKLACSFKNTIYDEEWGTGTKTFIRTIFETAQNHDFNFFNEYLEPLFYNALNQKRGSTEYYQLFNCKIPFLNGGLFEPIYKYDWQNVNVQISNEFFSNEDNKGLLDLFDMYNFTINEDEPLEKEVAVDPEMLGKIFENLLEVKERKSKGAFYTPREIVHYMCQESLINYLSNETEIPSEDIELFIKYGEIIKDIDINIDKKEDYKMPQTIIDNLEKIDNALENVTVADPAVGSGAFPLGMLNEIVKARSIIVEYMTKDLIEWQKEDFIRDNKRDLYNLKKDAMKKSIFAVDIEPSAVDITKLRLWLSLVVDSDVKTVNTLPNLDYNIMVGNSLIDEYEGIKLFDEELLKDKPKRRIENKSSQIRYEFGKDNDLIGIGIEQEQEILENIQNLQYELFDEKNTKRKIQIKDEIENKEWELIEYKLLKDNKKEEFKKLEKTRSENRKPYFLWKMNFSKIFKEKGGFDIVIGNPPYIGFQNVPNKKYYKNKYFSANGKYDFYVLFIERGIELLKNKGIISFICPSYFYKRNYGKNIRKLILENVNIKFIVDFKDNQVFDSATTYTCIFGFEKDYDNDNKIKIFDGSLDKNSLYKIPQISLSEPVWMLEKNEDMQLVNLINTKSKFKFGDITKSISQGIVTGNNTVFILNKQKIEQENMNMNFLKQVYKGKDIRNGVLINNNEFIFYPYEIDEKGNNKLIKEEVIKENNPNLYNYLLSKKDLLLSRKYFLKSNKKWYELWNCRKKNHFINRKFVFSEVNKKNDFVLCDECFYSDSACGAELVESFKKYEIYIQKYLNSSVITELYKKISVPKANGYLIYKNAFLKNLPIYIPDNIDNIYNNILEMNEKEFEDWLYNELKK